MQNYHDNKKLLKLFFKKNLQIMAFLKISSTTKEIFNIKIKYKIIKNFKNKNKIYQRVFINKYTVK